MTVDTHLGNVAMITMGLSPKGDTYNFTGDGLPLLNGPTEFGPIYPNCSMYTTDSKRECKKGDLIFCVRGSTTGRMNWADKTYSLGRGVCSIRGRSLKETKFVKYCLELRLNALLQFAGGGTFPNLNKPEIENLLIPYPKHRLQITNILSAYDDLIENNTRRIAILEQMAHMLYQEWFVKFRFPGHEQVSLMESELGMIPEEWKVVKLADVAGLNLFSITKGNEPKEINYVDISSVTCGNIDKIEVMQFVSAPGRARRILKHGDTIWSTVRPNRKSYSLVLNPVENMIASTGFAVISARKIPYTYLYSALTTDTFVDYLTNHATGSAYPAVNSNVFFDALVLLPSVELLNSFHEIASDIFLHKYNLSKRNANLRRTRDLLLPKLISGEIDVSHWVQDGQLAEVAAFPAAMGQVSSSAQRKQEEVTQRRLALQSEVAPIKQEELVRHSLWE